MIHAWDVAALVDVIAQSDHSSPPQPYVTWTEHSLTVACLRFGGGIGLAARLMSCSADRTLRIWSLPARRCLLTVTLPAPANVVVADAFDHRVYVGCQDGSVHAITAHAAALMQAGRASISGGSHANSLPPAPSLLSGYSDAALPAAGASALASGSSLAGAASAQLSDQFLGHTAAVNDLALSDDGQTLVTASDDATVRVWDVTSRQLLFTYEGHTGSPVRVLLLLPRPLRDIKTARHGAATSLSAAPVLLRKHQLPMPADWRGSSTGPLDRDVLVHWLPSVPADDVFQRLDTEYNNAVRRLAAYSQGNKGLEAPATAGTPEDDVEMSSDKLKAEMAARIAQLESECERWKVVNNQLMAQLKSSMAATTSKT